MIYDVQVWFYVSRAYLIYVALSVIFVEYQELSGDFGASGRIVHNNMTKDDYGTSMTKRALLFILRVNFFHKFHYIVQFIQLVLWDSCKLHQQHPLLHPTFGNTSDGTCVNIAIHVIGEQRRYIDNDALYRWYRHYTDGWHENHPVIKRIEITQTENDWH